MATTKKQQQWAANYNAKAYDEIKMRFNKGEKERIVAEAKKRGLSLNRLVTVALEKYLYPDQK